MCVGPSLSIMSSPNRRRRRPSPPPSPPPPSPPPHLIRDANLMFAFFYMVVAAAFLLASMPMAPEAAPRPLPRQWTMSHCINYRVVDLDEPYSDASAQ